MRQKTKATVCAILVVLLGIPIHHVKNPKVKFIAPPEAIELDAPAPPILELPR